MKFERPSCAVRFIILGFCLLLASTIKPVRADIWHELYYDTEDFDAEENQLPSPNAERFPVTIPIVGDPPGPSLDAVNLPDETELILPEPGPEQWHDAGAIPDGDKIPLEQQKEEEPINTAEPAPAANPAQEPSSPGTLPLAPMCSPPVAEESAQPPAAAQEPVQTPETEEENSDNSVPDRRRMLVQFLVTIDNFTETSFESRGRGILVQAIKDAAKQFGAKADVHIRIVKVWRLTKSNRRSLLQSHLATSGKSEGLNVQAQVKFEAGDEAAALEFTDVLSTSPTSIFHEEEFGNVTVPDIDLVPFSESTSWIPIVLGAAAGLAVCLVVTVAYLKKKTSSYHPACIPEIGDSSSILSNRGVDQSRNEYIRASWTQDRDSVAGPPASSRLNLLGSISSKKYTAPSDTYPGRELVVNNLGLYSYNK